MRTRFFALGPEADGTYQFWSVPPKAKERVQMSRQLGEEYGHQLLAQGCEWCEEQLAHQHWLKSGPYCIKITDQLSAAAFKLRWC